MAVKPLRRIVLRHIVAHWRRLSVRKNQVRIKVGRREILANNRPIDLVHEPGLCREGNRSTDRLDGIAKKFPPFFGLGSIIPRGNI
jgi:hypothetical protein